MNLSLYCLLCLKEKKKHNRQENYNNVKRKEKSMIAAFIKHESFLIGQHGIII